MSSPVLTSGEFIQNQVYLFWSSPLDTSVNTPLSCFSFNFEKVPVIAYNYLGNNTIRFVLGNTLTEIDRLTFTYNPPVDPSLGLQGLTPNGSSSRLAAKSRIPQIYNFKLQNLMVASEVKDHYNLGDQYPTTVNTTSPYSATVDDYIMAFGEKEAIQISNLDNASAITINSKRILNAIADANALIDAYIKQAPKAGKLLVSSSRRRTALTIARYYLDTVSRRKDVLEDYQRCIKELDVMADPTRGSVPTTPDEELAINNGGIMRSWKIPQRYNSVSGKGLDGYITDPAFDKPPHYRYNNQDNNNKNNHKPGVNDNANDLQRYYDDSTLDDQDGTQ